MVYVFGFVFFLLVSSYGLVGAIAYKTWPLWAAVVGCCTKAVLMIIGLIAIGVTFGKDGRFESNGKTYEIDMTAVVLIGFICK